MSNHSLSIFIALCAGAVTILSSIDFKEHPTKSTIIIGVSVLALIASIWIVFNDGRKSDLDAVAESQRREDEKNRIQSDSLKQRETDERILQIVETTSQILQKTTGQQLTIDDVLSEVSGEMTPEGLVIKYRLKTKLKSLSAIWDFNSFDSSFGPSFGNRITIEGLPTEVGENTYIVSTEGMARDQTVPFELRGYGPYVRARHDVVLKDGVAFKVDKRNVISDKVILK